MHCPWSETFPNLTTGNRQFLGDALVLPIDDLDGAGGTADIVRNRPSNVKPQTKGVDQSEVWKVSLCPSFRKRFILHHNIFQASHEACSLINATPLDVD